MDGPFYTRMREGLVEAARRSGGSVRKIEGQTFVTGDLDEMTAAAKTISATLLIGLAQNPNGTEPKK